MITLRTYLRTSRTNSMREGIIYFIIGDIWISSNVKVSPVYWDADHGIIVKSHPRYYLINPTWQQVKSRAEQCISNYQTSGKKFSRAYFEKYVFIGPEEADDPLFSDLVDNLCDVKDFGWGRIQHYKVLKVDVNSVCKNARLSQINYAFGLKFQKYLRTKPGEPNNQNTIFRKLAQLKAVVHHAKKLKLISDDPLEDIKIGDISGDKEYHTLEEVDLLQDLFQQQVLTGSRQEILRYYLFSCFTGLRYSDVIDLKKSEVALGFVTTRQEKTDKPVKVPLIPEAIGLLVEGDGDYCFKTYTDQTTNRQIKQIMGIAGIDKHMTFHCSRHTFATMSIFLGIPLEVVADVMGVSMKTVKIYARVIDQLKVREMAKWDRRAVGGKMTKMAV